MTGVWATLESAKGSGTSVKGISVADDSGALKPAVAGYVQDGTGTWVRFWPLTVTITNFVVTQGTPTYSSAVLTWSGYNATAYTLYSVSPSGAETQLYTGTGTTYTVTGLTPSTTYTYKLKADGVITMPSTLGSVYETRYVTTDTAPAPTGLTATAPAYNQINLSWNAVTGASAYDVINQANAVILNDVAGTSASVTGLTGSTTYTLGVRAVVNGANGNAAFASATTPIAPPAAGTYIFKPTAAYTWQAGQSGGQSAGWRSTADDYYHGDGAAYTSTRGAQSTFFWYGSNAFAKLTGLTADRLVSMEIYVQRASSSGSSAQQYSRLRMHTHSSKPSGAPSFPSNYFTSSEALAFSEDVYHNVPQNLEWTYVSGLINKSYYGTIWGGTTTAYMRAVRDLGSATPVGTIKIVIS